MKLIFFDIDGTLVPFGGQILDSSLQAIKKAQNNGHKLFIATGRSKSQVSKKLINIGFDGLVCATGGYVEYHDKIVYHDPFTRDQMKTIVDSLTKSNSFFVEQAYRKIFLTTPSAIGMTNNITGQKDSELTLDQIMKRENSWGEINIDDNTAQYYKNHDRADSYCYCESEWKRSEFRANLPKELKILPPSFMPINDYAGEIMLERTSKLKGILKIAEELNVDVNDLYAFGDGDNDLEMLKGCGTGIAMANATAACKAAADYITDDQHNDGIYNAMKKLGLI